MDDPSNLENIMDLALIFNSFLDIGFKPYIINNSYANHHFPDQIKNQFIKEKEQKISIEVTIDELQSNHFNKIVKCHQNKVFKESKHLKLKDNNRNTKTIIQKENLLKLNSLFNYWDIVSIVFGEFDACRFALFNYEGAKGWNEKAIGWILLLLTQTDNLSYIFDILYSIEFIEEALYDPFNSYIC